MTSIIRCSIAILENCLIFLARPSYYRSLLSRALGRHFLLRVRDPTIWISKGPKQNLKGLSIEIHYQFSNFGRYIGPSGKISEGPPLDFQGPGALTSGPPRARDHFSEMLKVTHNSEKLFPELCKNWSIHWLMMDVKTGPLDWKRFSEIFMECS